MRAALGGMPDAIRRRVHLVSLPMDDIDENAAMVNALQRRADIIVQKSIAEGFGLTVAEAMWKAGSRWWPGGVGGIQDQIVDGESGLLLRIPATSRRSATAIDACWRIRSARHGWVVRPSSG